MTIGHRSPPAALLAASLVFASACASSDSAGELLAPASRIATVRVLNAMRDSSGIEIQGLDIGASMGALDVGDIRKFIISPVSEAGPRAIVVHPVGGEWTMHVAPTFKSGDRTLIVVFGATDRPLIGFSADTLERNPLATNVRVALLATDVPPVRMWVLPATESPLGRTSWLSVPLLYKAPFMSPYFHGPSGDVRVHIGLYNPGGSEPVLASTAPFRMNVGGAAIVLFDRGPAGYRATVANEALP